MKKLSLVFGIIFIFIFLMPQVNASTKMAKLTGNQVSLRTGPGTNNSVITYLLLGSVYSFADETLYPNQQGCSDGWYKINFDGNTTGYVCSTYISVIVLDESNGTPSNDCEITLSNLGFPSSYWSGLCALKTKYPNWNFKPINTNLDWQTVIEKESACGRSYIATSNQEYIDSSCTNAYPNTWYPASSKAVAYYMDPRNWFDEKFIFQFEYLKYDSGLSNAYPSGVKAIIQNASFYQYHLSIGNDFSNIINTAGSETDVSPIFLASRMLQELGTSTSLYNLYSGAYTGNGNQYYGYYNFFNYGVTDTCATTYGPAYCGLSYAKDRGWNSPLNAIKGAASSLAANYISVGQYTGYLQKYNVVPVDNTKLYTHQYMTNVAAPSSESKSAYNSYSKLGMLNEAFTFYIPVYIGMDSTINNSGSGASGDSSSSASSMAISSIVTSSGYKYSSGIISGISIGTDVSTLISSIHAISGTNVIVKNGNNEVTSGVIGTGFTVTISNDTTRETLTVVIKGDVSGDGKVNALDLLQIQQNILGTYNLNDVAKKAADPSGDGKVNALDLLQVQQNILGTYQIVQ